MSDIKALDEHTTWSKTQKFPVILPHSAQEVATYTYLCKRYDFLVIIANTIQVFPDLDNRTDANSLMNGHFRHIKALSNRVQGDIVDENNNAQA